MSKPKILAIVGSLRKDSFNKQLALAAQAAIGDRCEFEILEYADVPFFNEDYEYPAPESVVRVREKVKAADGLWFFTPEYNHYFSGVMKNLLDWLSRPISETERPVIVGKAAALSGTSLGTCGTAIAQDHLVTLISLFNVRVMNSPRLTIPNTLDQCDENGKLVLTTSAPFLEKQANAFVKFLSK